MRTTRFRLLVMSAAVMAAAVLPAFAGAAGASVGKGGTSAIVKMISCGAVGNCNGN